MSEVEVQPAIETDAPESDADSDAASGGDGAATIEVDEATAAAIAEVQALLALPLHATASAGGADAAEAAAAAAGAPSLDDLLAASGAPLALGVSPTGAGRCLTALRRIAAGETVLTESATAWFVARSPGGDGLFSISARDGTLLAALPSWPALRTLRDTLTLAPAYVGRGDAAWALLSSLAATEGAAARGAWADAPPTPPGVPPRSPGGGDNAVPPRAQLLAAIAQCNAFSAALPAEDSAWKRGVLWPALCRLGEPGDRERLWDDATPLSHVSAMFPLAAQFNHACGPPVVRYTCAWAAGAPAPTITFVAAVDIAAGAEVTHDYTGGEALGVGERRRKLLLSHRFKCGCATCRAELRAAAAAAAVGAGGGGSCGAGGDGGECVKTDALSAHFPFGTGVDGTAHFFASGGRYPRC